MDHLNAAAAMKTAAAVPSAAAAVASAAAAVAAALAAEQTIADEGWRLVQGQCPDCAVQPLEHMLQSTA